MISLSNCFDTCSSAIFSKRDSTREFVKQLAPLKFKSVTGNDVFYIPAMFYDSGNTNGKIILYFHGGGWVRGSIESHDCLCRKLVNTLNIRLISVDYRLAPQHKFPTALNDALSVYCGLFADNGIDFEEIIISGDSSGGNLCAALCIKLKETGFIKTPKAQILFYPVLSNDFNSDSFKKFGHEINLTKSMMQMFVKMYTGKNPEDIGMINNKLLYPLLEDDMSVFPKTLIISAEKDVLLDGQISFASKLQKAGAKIRQIIIKDAKHGFMTYGNDHCRFASAALERIKTVF